MKKLILVLSALIGLLASCREKDPNDQLYDNNYFPNTSGLVWKYERYDSLQNKNDTVIVAITGDSLISGSTWKIWEYAYSDKTDTIFVRQNYDSIFMFNPSAVVLDMIFYIPFELGQGWHNPRYYNDTCYVSDIEDVVVDEITYQDVFRINHELTGPNYYLWENIWFKPHLGIVQLKRTEFNTAPSKYETWRLIEP